MSVSVSSLHFLQLQPNIHASEGKKLIKHPPTIMIRKTKTDSFMLICIGVLVYELFVRPDANRIVYLLIFGGISIHKTTKTDAKNASN